MLTGGECEDDRLVQLHLCSKSDHPFVIILSPLLHPDPGAGDMLWVSLVQSESGPPCFPRELNSHQGMIQRGFRDPVDGGTCFLTPELFATK
mmetsp:Transcript_50327/g.102551  ORF Transcript_50327/g.102551 Transcript_50327/m.102551 type:complete len:92 (-) Transcript_50327:484-759(-)